MFFFCYIYSASVAALHSKYYSREKWLQVTSWLILAYLKHLFFMFNIFNSLFCFSVFVLRNPYFPSIFISSSVCPPSTTTIYLFPLSSPPILSLTIQLSVSPMWTGHSDLYLSGMDESQVWFKCPNYSPELWCPALGYVARSLWLSYESWHSTTEPFTEARLRARSHEWFSPCSRPWQADGWCGNWPH